jgi:hypothetical protein
MGATMKCSFGLSPSKLIPTPKTVMTSNMMAANILDHIPFMNIPSFGMCICPSNPLVAAAMATPPPGVLKPQPCIPATFTPWATGAPTVMLCNAPALDNMSKLVCSWGGVIMFLDPGQTTHMIPP